MADAFIGELPEASPFQAGDIIPIERASADGRITVTAALAALSGTNTGDQTPTSLGLVIGTHVQAYSANLDEYAALNPTAAGLALLDDVDAPAQRTTLGLGTAATQNTGAFDAAGTAAAAAAAAQAASQPLDSDLTAVAALTTTAYGRALLELANAAALQTAGGVVIGTNVQAFDAELAAIAGLTSAADRLSYFTGSGTASLATFTAAGRALVDDADASAQRDTLSVHARVDHATYIAGLELSWVSTSAINIGPGSAYVESVGKIVNVAATINLTGLSLGNSAWGYVYLKNDGTAECNTTAPAAAYAGFARSKASDTSRRFLGAVKTDTSGNIIRFQHDPVSGFMDYREKTSSTFRVLSAGAATSKTAIDCSIAIPETARMGFGRLTNLGSVSVYFGSNEDAIDTSTLNYAAISPGAQGFFPFPLDSNQDAAYLHTGAGGSAYFDVYGYYNVR